MASELRRGLAPALALALAAALLALQPAPALAAGSWWQRLDRAAPRLTAIASSSGSETLALAHGGPVWFDPSLGAFSAVDVPAPQDLTGAVAVAAAGRTGVVLYRDGRLLRTALGGGGRWLPSLAGRPIALALGAGTDPALAALTSNGLLAGRLGSRLARVAPGEGTAILAPPRGRLPWLAMIGGRLWSSRDGLAWSPVRRAPSFAAATRCLAELGSGTVLVGEPSGLVWRGWAGSWRRAFQVLPYGGLGSVPRLTGLVGDGASAAYLATLGFGTLLTPDGGYSWYRAAPSDQELLAVATVGPVFARRAHGFVVALSEGGILLHHLQPLPAPPVYVAQSAALELGGTAAVVVGSVLLVLLSLGYWGRRRARRSL